jgi:hypothetical protein
VTTRSVRSCYVPDGGGSADPGPCAGDACGSGCRFELSLGLLKLSSLAFENPSGDAPRGAKASSRVFATGLPGRTRWKRTQICQVVAGPALGFGLLAAGFVPTLPPVTAASRRDALDSSRLYTCLSALRWPAKPAKVAVAVKSVF